MPITGVEDKRKRQVMNAALECILEQGIEAVTLDKTASKAGVSKGVIIYYFKSKKKMLLSALEYFLDGYINIIDDSLSEKKTPADPKEILLLIGKVLLEIEPVKIADINLSPVQAGAVMTQFYTKSIIDDDFKGIFLRMYENYHDLMMQVLVYGEEAGTFSIQDKEAVLMQLMAMLEGMILLRAVGYISDSGTAFTSYRLFIDTL